MIKYNNILFRDRLQLFIYLCKIEHNNFPHSLFLHSNIYYCRAALEYKFNTSFSIEEVQTILKDTTWQISLQPQTKVTEETISAK